MKKPLKIIIILLIVIIVAIIILGLWLAHVPNEITKVEEIDSEAHWGKIGGSLGYPSEEIPALGICAETTDGYDQYCTYEMLEGDDYTYNLGYEISVPPGDYHIFSYLIDPDSTTGEALDDYQAYYSQFVVCGMDISCTGHKAVKVTVDRNETVTRIDPIDWYDF
ncbi:MAG: hypothetical protein ABIB97_04600 [Patescibacteria group bacterium]